MYVSAYQAAVISQSRFSILSFVMNCCFFSSNASSTLNSASQHYIHRHSSSLGSSSGSLQRLSANNVTTLGSPSVPENSSVSSPGSGRLSDLLRRLGFFASSATIGTSDVVVGPSEEETDAASVLPDVCKARPDKAAVGLLSGGETSGGDRSDVARRSGIGDSTAAMNVGLNTMMSLKRRVGVKRDGLALAAAAGSSAGVHLRSQMVRQPAAAAAACATRDTSFSTDSSSSSLDVGTLDFASQVLKDSCAPGGILQSVGARDNRGSSSFGSNLISSSSSASYCDLLSDRTVPSIIVSPELVDADVVNSLQCCIAPSASLSGAKHGVLYVPSVWDRPSSCRTSCLVTSSLSTVVHSRIGNSSTSASNSDS
jgi:hypothetical protein